MMQDALEGQTLGNYQLQRRIGWGGMADVYLAFDKDLHREVALKVVHRARTDDLARFQREIEMLAPLAHEHILPVYDSGQEGSWHYLVMPYIDYGTLADLLHTRGPLTPGEAGVLLDQLAGALQYAHERGILHRDIKPSNILLRDDAYAYLTDFGIAKSLLQESSLTRTGFYVGTPEYMAPELSETPATQSSDVYALGIALYAMLVGKSPFTGSNPLAIMQKHLQEMPVAPARLNPAISPAVEQVILRALAKDPRQRFQSAQAFANAYRHALQAPNLPVAQAASIVTRRRSGSAVGAQSTPSTRFGVYYPLQPARTRYPHLFFVYTLLVLLLILSGSLVAALSLSQRAGRQPTMASTIPTTAPARTPTPATSSTNAPTTARITAICSVNDAAHVLNQGQLCPGGLSPLSHSLMIDSSNAPKDKGDSFDVPRIPSAQTIVITLIINQPHHGHGHPSLAQIMITGGSAIPLTRDQYQSAQNAFDDVASSGDYTHAILAAIQSLQASGA